MPIIHMWDEPRADGPYSHFFPQGSRCAMSQKPSERDTFRLYETHHGLCLFDREYNGYDDSDFYMTYWDEQTGRPVEVMFATTRGWSYPCYESRPDATPEIKAKYEAWRIDQARAAELARRAERARQLAAARVADREIAAIAGGVPVLRVRSLRRSYAPEVFAAIERLLRTKKFRSTFRANVAQQVREWLADPAPMYATPLSRRQLEYI